MNPRKNYLGSENPNSNFPSIDCVHKLGSWIRASVSASDDKTHTTARNLTWNIGRPGQRFLPRGIRLPYSVLGRDPQVLDGKDEHPQPLTNKPVQVQLSYVVGKSKRRKIPETPEPVLIEVSRTSALHP